tara:strand:+ start:1513 stop:2736 length:1224 start_codon:yes stop_codon:yes gene_type:complete
MHILESYALQNDLKIDKPSIYEKFFPLAVDKFITIDTSNLGTAALTYDYWHLVVDLIYPELKKQNIQIVQLGNKGDAPIPNCYMALGQCNFNQKVYIINKALVHCCPNNESMHVASSCNKKCVALFSNNSFPDQFAPYWSNKDDIEVICPPLEGKPSFNPNESPKSINRIKPEEVATKILNLSGIFAFVTQFETLRIGHSFNQKRIESTLTHILDPRKLGVSSLIIRMDLNFDEESLKTQLERCPCSIITNQPLHHEILERYSKKIAEVVYYVEDDDPLGVEFISKVKEKSINYLLRSRVSKEEIRDYKLMYFDYGLVNHIPRKSQEDFKELKGIKNLYYKSQHFIIHNNSFYPSNAALLADESSNNEDSSKRQNKGFPSMDHEPQQIIDDPLFWEEEEHFHFFIKK